MTTVTIYYGFQYIQWLNKTIGVYLTELQYSEVIVRFSLINNFPSFVLLSTLSVMNELWFQGLWHSTQCCREFILLSFLLYRWYKINIYYISKDFYIHGSILSVNVFFLLLTFHYLGIKQVVKHSMVIFVHDFFHNGFISLFRMALFFEKFTFQTLCLTSLLRIYFTNYISQISMMST